MSDFIGLHKSRLSALDSNHRERAFVYQWQTENDLWGTLDRLFEVPQQNGRGAVRPLGKPTDRDRIVVETVIQWLGSNCGLSFLQEALGRCDYGIKFPRDDETD